MKTFALFLALATTVTISAQSISTKLATAFHGFETDGQMKNGIASLYVIDAATGKPVFEKNANIGLAPASTQKIITSAAAYEILGKEFSYTTTIGYTGELANGVAANLVIKPSGDPTLGSWRWKQTAEAAVIKRIADAIEAAGIRQYYNIVVNEENWNAEAIPGGWIWDDIANYYGAGAAALNWRENQFDLLLQSGNVGDPVVIKGTKPALYNYEITSAAKAAAKGTGDNAYIYFPVGRTQAVVRGTIPAGENNFSISGTIPSAQHQFINTLTDSLAARGITRNSQPNASTERYTIIHREQSPPLDSISYWFLRRSINLYGEALAKIIALEAGKEASTANGMKQMKDFWKEKNIDIDASAINMYDGSGLSPLNRVTTKAQVMILKYARQQPWFSSYYHGIPEFNNMKMKSGTINGVKGFAGYHRSASGKEYIFSFIVNNYNGSASSLVQKMYKVLNTLK